MNRVRKIPHRTGGCCRSTDPVVGQRSDGLNVVARALASLPVTYLPHVPPRQDAPHIATDALVCVAIICHNYGQYLSDAIESALDQDYPNCHVVVIDDGSTDDTAAVAARYASRVTYVHQRNAGAWAAKNRALLISAAPLVVFLDADDRLHADYVSSCVRTLAVNPGAAFVYTQNQSFGTVCGPTHHPSFDPEVLAEYNYISSCSMVVADVARLHPFRRTNAVGTLDDYDFFLGLVSKGFWGVLCDRILFDYRRHDTGSWARSVPVIFGAARLRIRLRHGRLVGLRSVSIAGRRLARYALAAAIERLRHARSEAPRT